MYWRTTWTRRGWLKQASATVGALSGASWLQRLASATESAAPIRSCILLWMDGGPSQTDTFDLKPGHAHGGPFQPVATSTPGVMLSEHLPSLARWTDHMAIIRSMSTKEGDHGRARQHLRTGYLPQASIQFPMLGSLVSNAVGAPTGDLPHYVSILPRGLFSAGVPAAGFLGPAHAPLLVGGGDGAPLAISNLSTSRNSIEQFERRFELQQRLQQNFLQQRPGAAAEGHRTAYDQARRLMSASAQSAFQLDDESPETRARYGDSSFGQGCLLARRLIERNVPFVEVSLGGWDSHVDNFTTVQRLSTVLDGAWSSLLQDLQDRGRLSSTLVVWMGEFGRTPVINPQVGRDHYPKAWSAVLAGGGIVGGSVVGRTGDDGLNVVDRPVSTPDLLATICLALGINPQAQNMSNVARPIRVVDPEAEPVREILA